MMIDSRVMLQSRRWVFIWVVVTVSLLLVLSGHSSKLPSQLISNVTSLRSSDDVYLDLVAEYFANYPLTGPYKHQFGELGSRVRIVQELVSISDERGTALDDSVEHAIASMFPFLLHQSNQTEKGPFSRLRKSFITGSCGIVIPTGLGTFRFASHLVLSIRNVHHSGLPIQIVYAGEDDLPFQYRALLASLVDDVEFLDVLEVFDDEILKLKDGGWAIKAFAALASKYETVILADADAVLVQAPELFLEQQGYRETGTLFYHDRLLWQHVFAERHKWWREEMEHHLPSSSLLNSLVWMEDYAEEQDSGLVVINKSRLPVLMGLLHVCWQNSFEVRDEITYKITYGDKESWWFGFELCGTPFSFEQYYGSIVGWRDVDETEGEKVCSFTIAHTDDNGDLLWYNGSLLKNKAVDENTFEVPTHWMKNATWQKGNSKPDISCMKGGIATKLTQIEMSVIEQSVEAAKAFDAVARGS